MQQPSPQYLLACAPEQCKCCPVAEPVLEIDDVASCIAYRVHMEERLVEGVQGRADVRFGCLGRHTSQYGDEQGVCQGNLGSDLPEHPLGAGSQRTERALSEHGGVSRRLTRAEAEYP